MLRRSSSLMLLVLFLYHRLHLSRQFLWRTGRYTLHPRLQWKKGIRPSVNLVALRVSVSVAVLSGSVAISAPLWSI